MSEGTTKPNGSREMEVKKDVDIKEIENRISIQKNTNEVKFF